MPTSSSFYNDENKLIINSRKSSFVTSSFGPVAASKTKSLTKNAKSSSPNIVPNNKSPVTNTFQKFYSFHKSSYNLDLRNSCTCFSMPHICDICTSK